jgi:hypothetical protein
MVLLGIAFWARESEQAAGYGGGTEGKKGFKGREGNGTTPLTRLSPES